MITGCEKMTDDSGAVNVIKPGLDFMQMKRKAINQTP